VIIGILTQIRIWFLKAHFTGHQDRMPDLHTQTLAIDRQRPTSCHWQASFVFWYKESILSMLHHPAVNRTHSGSSASGTKKCACSAVVENVVCLDIDEGGGFSGTSQGVIYSSTAPFILFVSSDLATQDTFLNLKQN